MSNAVQIAAVAERAPVTAQALSAQPTAIVLTAADARRFASDRPCSAVMALSPVARAALEEAETGTLVPEPLTDWSHARMVARAHRGSDEFCSALSNRAPNLRAGTWHAVTFTFLEQAYLIGRIWETLRGGGPWALRDGDGWITVGERTTALVRLVDQLSPDNVREQPPLRGLFRGLRQLVLRLLRHRGPWLVTRRPGLVFGLEKALAQRDVQTRRLVVSTQTEGVREYAKLFQSLRDGLSAAPVVRTSITGEVRGEYESAVERALDELSDPVLARGFTALARSRLVEQTAICEGLFDDARAVLGAAAPSAYMTRQDSGQYAVVSDAAGSLGIPRFAINYNSFPVNSSAIADKLMRTLFHVRMPQGLSDHHVMWSPHIAKTADLVYDEAVAARLLPLRIPPVDASTLPRAAGQRRILYASNYSEYAYFVPWIIETSNEFLDDILAVARELERLDNVELTIRTKPKGECKPETLQHFIPQSERIRVTGVRQPFEEALRDADLLISFSSTTVEEGVLGRKPVLLWGPLSRYQHLPAQRTPPTDGSRAAFYAVSEPSELGPMISAILDAHAGRPLTDEEIAQHVWPEGTPEIDRIAALIAEGGRRQ